MRNAAMNGTPKTPYGGGLIANLAHPRWSIQSIVLFLFGPCKAEARLEVEAEIFPSRPQNKPPVGSGW